jgi:hypothetical protein
MVEIFKTNVSDQTQADLLLYEICQIMSDCAVNFDLEDCDRILRIKYEREMDPSVLITLLNNFGFDAEVLL